jgi:uroporphyrinogen-III synthase
MPRLAGRKLLITRSADDAGDWARTLALEGATPIVFPCVHSEPVGDAALARSLAAAISRADWLVCTSRRGVDRVAALAGTAVPSTVRLAAVGTATAARFREHFGRCDLVGGGTAAALGAELREHLSVPPDATARPDAARRPDARCVLALATNAGPDLAAALTAAGATVERFDVYRTVPAGPLEPRRPLSGLGCDTVIFASPTAVRGFANQVHVDRAGAFVTIGPSTSKAVRAQRWDVAAEAREPSLSGIIASMLEATHA